METTVVTVPTGDERLLAPLDRLCLEYPRLYDRLDPARVRTWQEECAAVPRSRDDFGPAAAGGRGESYVRAQQDSMTARAHGIEQLLRLFGGSEEERGSVVLDLLGGDGLLRRVADLLGFDGLDLLTCDLSPHMVDAAWSCGLPALLQSADRLLFRSGSVDGVLLAYGTHHIPPGDRLTVVDEGFRVLRPGGAFVMHDFESGGAMDTWFSEVVDPYSDTGHRFEHFGRDEMTAYLEKAGFEDGTVLDVEDPYRVVADSPHQAELAMGHYLLNMYGLVGIARSFAPDRAAELVLDRAREVFGAPLPGRSRPDTDPRLDPDTGRWHLEIPRSALVAVAHRPSR